MVGRILNDPPKKAIEEYLKLIEKSPNDERLHLKLGDLYFKNGDPERAIKAYLKTAELFVEEDLNTRAIAIYKRVLSIDPNHMETLHHVAELYLKERLLGDAKGCYEKILKVRPNDQDALKGLSMIEDLKHPKKVESKIEKEEFHSAKPEGRFSENPSTKAGVLPSDKELELHYHLGIGYKEMGLFDYAIHEFELASEDPSMKFDCYIMLGECFKEKGESEKAAEYFEWASKIKELPKNILPGATSKSG